MTLQNKVNVLVQICMLWLFMYILYLQVKDIPIWTVGGILATIALVVVGILMGVFTIIILDSMD